jgi:hypothetical protein
MDYSFDITGRALQGNIRIRKQISRHCPRTQSRGRGGCKKKGELENNETKIRRKEDREERLKKQEQ